MHEIFRGADGSAAGARVHGSACRSRASFNMDAATEGSATL